MDIGIFQTLPDMRADPAVVAKRAEELGFESYWVPEHPIMPVESSSAYPGAVQGGPIPEHLWQMPDPFVALSRVSGVTDKIRLGTAICLVPERNPLLLAKEIASLDHYSNGRFLFGIGAGWHREECEIMGGDFDHRWTQVKHSILAMKQLWTTENSEYHGQYYDFPPVRSFPKPTQKPHPPVILGGATAKRVFNRIVEWGDGWMPMVDSTAALAEGVGQLKRLCDEKGRDFSTLSIVACSLKGQWRRAEDMDALKEIGVTRTILWLKARDLDGIFRELDGLAASVVG